jgi:hypothetical protein
MTTMTNEHYFNIACTIEELRREAKEAQTPEERLEIEVQMEALRAELTEHVKEQELP